MRILPSGHGGRAGQAGKRRKRLRFIWTLPVRPDKMVHGREERVHTLPLGGRRRARMAFFFHPHDVSLPCAVPLTTIAEAPDGLRGSAAASGPDQSVFSQSGIPEPPVDSRSHSLRRVRCPCRRSLTTTRTVSPALHEEGSPWMSQSRLPPPVCSPGQQGRSVRSSEPTPSLAGRASEHGS